MDSISAPAKGSNYLDSARASSFEPRALSWLCPTSISPQHERAARERCLRLSSEGVSLATLALSA
jgi:hypothetical protein